MTLARAKQSGKSVAWACTFVSEEEEQQQQQQHQQQHQQHMLPSKTLSRTDV